MKAVTETLRKHPTLNSQFADDKIILKQAMNIGIAVAVDNGLIVPVIANALEDLPESFEQLASTQSNIGRMRAAGVTVGIGMINDDEARMARVWLA